MIHTTISFATAHWVCKRCLYTIIARRLADGCVAALSVTLFTLSAICTILFMNEMLGMFIRAAEFHELHAENIMILSAGMLGAVPALLGVFLLRILGTPKSLRSVGRWPFALRRVTEIKPD